MSMGLMNPITGQQLPSPERWIDGFLYDRDPSGEGTTITAGEEFTYFATPRGQSSKTSRDTNMSIAGKLPDDMEALIWNVGVYLPPDISDGDLDHYMTEVTVRVELNQTIVREAPLPVYQSGYGISGGVAVATTATTTTMTEEWYQNGPTAAAAIKPLSIPIHIKSGVSVNVILRHDVAITSDAANQVEIWLHGWIGKGIVV